MSLGFSGFDTKIIEITAKHAHIEALILIIKGARSDCFIDGSNILPPSTSYSGDLFSGLAIAKETKPNINDPIPLPPNARELTNPLCFGKYPHPHMTGGKYISPDPKPKKNPYIIQKGIGSVIKVEENTPANIILDPTRISIFGLTHLIKNAPIQMVEACVALCKTHHRKVSFNDTGGFFLFKYEVIYTCILLVS